MRIEDDNYMGGEKSLFHSLRILKFGIQIIAIGEITDFSEANYIREEIDNFTGDNEFNLTWASYKYAWSPLRKELQRKLRNALPLNPSLINELKKVEKIS